MILETKFKINKKNLYENLEQVFNEVNHGIVLFNPSDIELSFSTFNNKIQKLKPKDLNKFSLISNDIVYFEYPISKYSENEYKELVHLFERRMIEAINNGNVKSIVFIDSDTFIHKDFLEYLEKYLSLIFIYSEK